MIHGKNPNKNAPDGHALGLCGFRGAGTFMKEAGWHVVDCQKCLVLIKRRRNVQEQSNNEHVHSARCE